MTKEYPLFIAGERQTSEERVEIRSPYSGETVGAVYLASSDQMEAAVSSTAKSAEHMASLPSYARAEILSKAASEIKSRSEEIARLIAMEAGKPIKAARVEVSRCVNTLTAASEESKRIGGEMLPLDWEPSSEGRIAIVGRFPIGPISAITPFNFPLNLVAHKLAPACAAGNPVALKPAPQSPLTAFALGEILLQAGWPAQALNVVQCTNEVARPLIADRRFKMLSFTGSASVGWMLKKEAFDKRVVLELGGNAGLIVHSDADLDLAASRAAAGGFGYAGQSCISVQRIFIHRPVYNDFVDRLLGAVKALKVGDPLEESTDVGPMISEPEAARAESWIREARDGGAEILCGGQRDGTLLEPTVIANASSQLKVSCKEIFAPVVTVKAYDDFSEALSLIDDSEYGLQAGLFTRDINRIFHAYRKLSLGGLVAGDVPTYRADHMPYGGVKESGSGREGVRYAIEEMTELKTLVLNLK